MADLPGIEGPPSAAPFNFKQAISQMVQRAGSDLHLKVGRPPTVRVNGMLCQPPAKEGAAVFVYPVPEAALADGVHVIEARAASDASMRIVRVEFAIGPKGL